MTDFLLAIVIILLLMIILLVIWTRKRVSFDDLSKAISEAWNKSSFSEIKTYAKDIRDDYRRLDEMLRVPKERANLGEIALEQILADQLPSEMFGIRKSVLGGKNPDAHIKSTVGIICIDSKFPLDNYRKLFETNIQDEKNRLKKDFIRDVEGHLKKIAVDYIVADKGSAIGTSPKSSR
jgi:DNA recombination protein RmuC